MDDQTTEHQTGPLTRPLLTRGEALALALLLGMPLAADAFDNSSPSPECEQEVVADTRPDAPELFVG
jgi:hypothetical protein